MKAILSTVVLGLLFPCLTWAKDAAEPPPAEPAKASYLQKANDEMRDWSAKIQSLEERSKQKGAQSRQELDRHVGALRHSYDEIRKNIRELSDSGDAAWSRFQKGLDESMDQLRKDYDKTVDTFHKK